MPGRWRIGTTGIRAGAPGLAPWAPMPVTFLAHQAPVLPLKRRWPGLDGVALVVGSTVPDLARVTERLPVLYVYGTPTWFDGHRPDQLVSWCLVVGLLITWSARRLVLPRLSGHLPDLGDFHLRDLRLVGRTRHRWWNTVGCVLIGASVHSLIDVLTHSDRPVSLPGSSTHLVELAGRSIDVANALQVAASVGLSVWAVVQMLDIGRSRDLARWSGAVLAPAPTPPNHRAVVAAVLTAMILTGAFAATQMHRGARVALMTWALAGWFSLCLIAATRPRPEGDESMHPVEVSEAAVDPLLEVG